MKMYLEFLPTKLIPQNKTQNIYEYFKDNMNEEE